MNNAADYCIIGGGVAGTTAAETIRARDSKGRIVLVGAERHPLYSRVLLPHFVRGKIKEEGVFIRKPSFYKEKGIEYLSNTVVRSIESAAKKISFADGSEISYDKLLIATGGRPRQLVCPGADKAGLLYLQTIEDARALDAVSTGEAVVIGGGFIAMEFALSFAQRNMPATVLLRGESFFSHALDGESGRRIAETMRGHGVKVRPRSTIKGIEADSGRKRVHLTDGWTCEGDIVAVGIGLEPNVGFLAGSGISVGRGVVVDEFLASETADVYAAGDVAEFLDVSTGGRRQLGNWANALFQGKAAGLNMSGERTPYKQLTSYSIACFDLPIAFLGAPAGDAERRVARQYHDGTITQFYLDGDRLIGASCVGKFADREACAKLITDGVALTPAARTALADAGVPLSSLIP